MCMYNHMPKPSICPVTASAMIWAHMLIETLFNNNENKHLYFLHVLSLLATGCAFVWVNIDNMHVKLYLL